MSQPSWRTVLVAHLVGFCCLAQGCMEPDLRKLRAGARPTAHAKPRFVDPARPPDESQTKPPKPKDTRPPLKTVLDKVTPLAADFEPVVPCENKGEFESHGELAHDGKQVAAVVFSGDGRRLVTATDEGTLTVWNVAEQRQEKRFSAASEPIAALAVSFDGKRALGAVGNRGVIWNLETGEQVCELVGHKTPIAAVALSGDSRLACTQATKGDDPVRLWDGQKGTELQHRPAQNHHSRGAVLMLSSDGHSVLSDASKFKIALDDTTGLGTRFQADRHQHLGLQSAWVSDDAGLIVEAWLDGTVVVNHGKFSGRRSPIQREYKLGDLGSPVSRAKAVRGTPGDEYAIIYGGGTQLDYRHVATFELAGRYRDQVEDVTRAALSPDGRHCASAYKDGIVRIWRMPAPELTSKQRQIAFARRVDTLLEQRDFDALEALYRETLAARQYYTDATPQLAVFHRGAIETDVKPRLSESQRTALVEEWLKAKPDSVAARVASIRFDLRPSARDAQRAKPEWSLEEPVKDQAQEERIEKEWAVRVVQLKRVSEVLTEASTLCQQQNLKDPYVQHGRMTVATLLDDPKETVLDLCQQGLAADAAYLPTLRDFGGYIATCSHGVRGEAAAFATAVSADTENEDEALQVYAEIGSIISCDGEPTEFVVNGFAMPDLRRGAVLLANRFPDKNVYAHFACMLACIDGDKAQAKEFMSLAGRLESVGIWRGPQILQRYRKWCFSSGSGEARLAIQAHTNPIFDLAWSHDEKLLVTVSEDRGGHVKIWDADTGKLVRTLPIEERVISVAISPDDQTLAVAGGEDGQALFELWDLKHFTRKRLAPGFRQTVSSCRYSSQGVLAGAGQDGQLKIWPADSSKPAVAIVMPGPLGRMCFSPDGRRLGVCESSQVQLIDVDSLAKNAVFATGCGQLFDTTLSSNLVAAAGETGLIEILDLAADKASVFGNASYHAVALSADGRLLAAGRMFDRDQQVIEIWDRVPRTLLHRFEAHSMPIMKLLFSADGRRLASAGSDGVLCLWDVSRYHPEPMNPILAAAIDTVETAGSGRNVPNAGKATGAARWRIGELHLLPQPEFPPVKLAQDDAPAVVARELDHAGQAVVQAVFLDDGKRLLTATKDGTLSLWDVVSGERVKHFPQAASDRIHALDVSADGKLAIGAVAREAIVWNLENGSPVVRLKGHTGELTCVAFGRDSRVATTGSRDGTLRLWEIPSGESLDPTPAKVHSAAWTSVQFSPDMKFRIAGAEDGAVAIEMMPGRETRLFEKVPVTNSPIQAVTVSPNNAYGTVVRKDGSASSFWVGQALQTAANGATSHFWVGQAPQTARTFSPTLNEQQFSSPPSPQKALRWLPDSSVVSIYSGGARLDYWHAQANELAGRHLPAIEDASCLALSPDGQMAVTGRADGLARLWKLPGPQLTEQAYQVDARKALLDMLTRKDYESLREWHSRALRTHAYTPFGDAEAEDFYNALSWSYDFDRETDAQGEKLLAALEQWASAQPEIPDPQIALALSHLALAAQDRKKTEGLRKDGDVSRPGDDHLAAASKALTQAENLAEGKEPADPMLYCAAGQVAEVLDDSKQTALAIYERGLQVDPMFLPIVRRAVADSFGPPGNRQNGDARNSVAAFVEVAAHGAASPDDQSQVYAAAATAILAPNRPVDFRRLGFSVSRLRQGAALLRKRFPKSSLYEQLACLLACAERDRTAAGELFERIGSRPRLDVWASREDYQRIRLAVEQQETDEAKKVIDAGIQAPVALSASSDGKSLLLGKRLAGPGIELYSGDWTAKPRVLPIPGEVTSAAINPSGDTVAVGVKTAGECHLEVWDLAKNERTHVLILQEPCVHCGYSPDGKYIAVVCAQQIVIWDRDFKSVRINLGGRQSENPSYTTLCFAPNGERFLFGGGSQPPNVYEWQLKSRVPIMPKPQHFRQLVMGNDYAVLAGKGDSIYLQDMEIFKPVILRDFDDQRAQCEVTALALAPDGNLLAAGHLDEKGHAVLELWNMQQPRTKRELHGHTGPIRYLTFLGNKKVASAADDGTIRIWDASAH